MISMVNSADSTINAHNLPADNSARIISMVKKGDFAEIVYTGRIKETGKVFDTNDRETAKKEGFFSEKANYHPIVICIGEGDVVKGLDEALEGKEAGKEFKVDVPAEKAFGKKDAKNYKLVPSAVFRNEMHPMPGLRVDFENGQSGVIKTVSGGRVLVDFNHPLAGQDLSYEVKIVKQVTDDSEKLKGFLKYYLGAENATVEIKDGKALIGIKPEVHDVIQKAIIAKAKKIMPELKDIEFLKEEKKDAVKKAEEKKDDVKKAPVKKA